MERRILLNWGPLSQDMETFYDPCHVDQLEDELLFQALKRKLEEVICARDDLRGSA